MAATVDAIAAVQEPDGSIPWFAGGQADPWNMSEAAMALLVGGRRGEAEAALRWLVRRQRADGAWPAYTRAGVVTDPTLDSNFTAYIATAAWLHHLVVGDAAFDAEIWPSVQRALDFVVAMQGANGEIFWARDAEGNIWRRGLVAGSSCIHLSLGCGLRLAAALDHDRPDWRRARARLAEAVATGSGAFEDRRRFAMDWYYPVLGGVLRGPAASARIAARWEEFVVEGRGVRCVSDRPWVTAAETCELVIALAAMGERETAARLFDWAHHLRGDDAAYWTGANFTDGAIWPEEQPSWTSAAVVLAADALDDGHSARLFADPGD